MRFIRFHHVFASLLLIAALTAFAVPARYTNKAHPQLQSLFAPVAMPVRAAAERVARRWSPPGAGEARSKEHLVRENEELAVQNALLQQQVEELRRLALQIESLGRVKDYVTLFNVVGVDSGSRDSLAVRGSTLEGLRQGMYVLYPAGVVGMIEKSPGLAGAQVRLVTDPGFRVRAHFGMFRKNDAGRLKFDILNTEPALVEGIGGGRMVMRRMVLEDLKRAGVTPGAWVVVDDPKWPEILQGYRLGKVAAVTPLKDHPLHAEVSVEPATDLRRLARVMVMTRE